MEHFGFILASYLVTIAIIALIGIWLFFDYRTQKKVLGALEARGIRRRSKTPDASGSGAKVGNQ